MPLPLDANKSSRNARIYITIIIVMMLVVCCGPGLIGDYFRHTRELPPEAIPELYEATVVVPEQVMEVKVHSNCAPVIEWGWGHFEACDSKAVRQHALRKIGDSYRINRIDRCITCECTFRIFVEPKTG